MRKPLNELKASLGVAVHELKELGQQEDLSTLEYVNNCIPMILPFGRFITTKVVGSDEKAIEICTKSSKTIWLAIGITQTKKRVPLLLETEYKPLGPNGSHTKPVQITLEKAVEFYKEDLEACGKVIDTFINYTVLPAIKKLKDALPTTEKLKQDRKTFLNELATNLQAQATELQAVADAIDPTK